MKESYRVIVAGSRAITDFDLVCRVLRDVLPPKGATIISGGARGVDTLGEQYARRYRHRIARFPADWNRYGKSAGFRRNTTMAEKADALVAFWDGESYGTAHMIKEARRRGLAVKVVFPDMLDSGPIRRFEGAYRWLSNFHSPTIGLDGWGYPTVEHAYQASKFAPDSYERYQVLEAGTPGRAKGLGRRLPGALPDFDSRKVDIMRALCEQKFWHEPYRSRLTATGDREIVWENTGGDTFWGVCRGRGQNHLGRILMDIRHHLAVNEILGDNVVWPSTNG